MCIVIISGAMDTFAHALLAASNVVEEGFLSKAVSQRYSSFNTGIGAKMEKGMTDLEELEVRRHCCSCYCMKLLSLFVVMKITLQPQI